MRFGPLPPHAHRAAMAEWLRRLTRNQMGSSRVGSNPTRSAPFARVAKYTPLYAHFNKITGGILLGWGSNLGRTGYKSWPTAIDFDSGDRG